MIEQIRIIEGWTRDLGIPETWWEGEIYNAARPFPCHEDKTGEFVHGIFYGVIWPDQEYADEHRKRTQALDAHRLIKISHEAVEQWGCAYCDEHGIDREDFEFDDIAHAYLQHAERN